MDGVVIANHTPHDIDLMIGDDVAKIPPSGWVLRCREEIKIIGVYGGITIIEKQINTEEIEKDDLEKLKEFAKKYDINIVSLITGKLIKTLYNKGIINEEIAKKYYVIGNIIRDENGKPQYADALSPALSL